MNEETLSDRLIRRLERDKAVIEKRLFNLREMRHYEGLADEDPKPSPENE